MKFAELIFLLVLGTLPCLHGQETVPQVPIVDFALERDPQSGFTEYVQVTSVKFEERRLLIQLSVDSVLAVLNWGSQSRGVVSVVGTDHSGEALMFNFLVEVNLRRSGGVSIVPHESMLTRHFIRSAEVAGEGFSFIHEFSRTPSSAIVTVQLIGGK